MHLKLRKYLETIGLDAGVTDDEAWTFFNALLEGDQKVKAESLAIRADADDATKNRSADDDEKLSAADVAKATLSAERLRVAQLKELASDDVPTELLEKAIADGLSVGDAGPLFIKSIRDARPPAVSVGVNHADELQDVLSDALMLSESDHGLSDQQISRAKQFSGIGLHDMARIAVGRNGGIVPHIADKLLATAITTGTFTNALGNTINRSLARGYSEFESTFRKWAGKRLVKDFRTQTDIRLGEFAAMEKINDAGEIPHDTFEESTESYSADTYGKQFNLTRKTFINDDLGVFTTAPAKLGRAMARNIDQIGYDLLISASGVGPTMNEDSKALFHASHDTSNYSTGGGSALDSTGMATAKKLMRKVKHGDVNINVVPRFLLVPPELEDTAMTLVHSRELMAKDMAASANKVQGTKNIHFGTLIPVVEPRLSDATNGATAWYLIASQAQVEHLVVVFLRGREKPTLERNDPAGVLGIGWQGYHDVGVAAVDWRGIERNKGV